MTPYNKQLLKQTTAFKELGFAPYPFITCISDSYAICNEVAYFEEQSDMFYGIKIYTGTSADILNDCTFDSNYPLILHTGLCENQYPKTMLKFIEKYSGPILIAHFAMFDKAFINRVKEKPNVYFDTCPAICAYNRYYIEKRNGGFIDCDKIKHVEDLYYKLIDLVGVKKVIWGSDYPFCIITDEISVLNALSIDEADKRDILYNNAKKFLITANYNQNGDY